jgi:hypothetical protein
MTRTLKGRVVDGKIELLEPLDAPDGAEVRVLVESSAADDLGGGPAEPLPRFEFGMFRPTDGRYSTEEDWQEIKKIWEPRDL